MMRANNLIVFLVLIALATVVNASEQPRYTRDALPKIDNELKLDESFKTNLFTGSFIYDYKVEIPPGTNELEPQLTMYYASQKATAGPPSILGSGWDYTQSYIQRDINTTVNDATNDKFVLVLNGNSHDLVYAAADGSYHTETETFMHIQNLNTENNQKGTYWIVKTSDGKAYRFGFYNSSEAVAVDGLYAWKWYLDQITDTYDNSIYYNYLENPYPSDMNATYLMNISYNNDRSRLINFVYENVDRQDLWSGYDNGNFVRIARKLNFIEITVASSLLRKYEFKYTTTDTGARMVLSNITVIGNDNSTSLPPTHFFYNPVITGYTENSTWYPPICFVDSNNWADAGTRLADVNGDGLVDIIRGISYTSEWSACTDAFTANAYINTGSGWIQNTSWNPPMCFVDYNLIDPGTRLADVNGDGLIDIVRSKDRYSDCDNDPYTWVYLNNGSGWSNSTWKLPVCMVNTAGDDQGVRLADVNGDGRADILWGVGSGTLCSASTSVAYINNGTGWEINATWNPPLCFLDTSRWNNSGTQIIDVNGDGLVDLVKSTADYDNQNACLEPKHKTYLNTGNGWKQDTAWESPICFNDYYYRDAGTRWIDVNGDGLIDIMRSIDNVSSPNCGHPINMTYINNGYNWTLNRSWEPTRCFSYVDGADAGVRLGDVDGDGFTDILESIGQGCAVGTPRAYTSNGDKPYLLSKITNTVGGQITINYKESTHLNNHGNDSINDLGFNLWIVSSVTQSNGMSGPANVTSTYIYNYSGGFYDYRDRESRGFSLAQETRPDGTRIDHYFHQGKVRTGREYHTGIFDNNSNLYQQKEYLWNYTVNETSGRFFVTELREENISTYDGLGGDPRTTKTEYAYDMFSNVIEKTQYGEAGVTGDEKYERFNYIYNTTAWIINKPKTYALFASDNTTKLRETNYSYDNLSYDEPPHRGSVTTKEDMIGNGVAITRYDYESHGNAENITDPNGHATKYMYGTTDATFTFPDRQINAKGHTIRYTYDLGFGKPVLVNDSNGVITTYTYDVFGRLAKEIRPYDTWIYPTKQYVYYIDGTAPEKIVIKATEATGTGNTFDSYQFYDGFSKSVLTKSEAEESKQIVTDMLYDKTDRLEIKSNPHKTVFSESYAEPDLSINRTNFTYDPIDRVAKIVNPDSTYKTFNYSKWNTTSTDENSNRQTQMLDAYGRIIKILEYNGDEVYVTTYTYDGADNLVKITDNLGNNFTFTYDLLGRKTGMTDPDMGTWNYTYDAAGNLVSQKDGRGIRTDFQYDGLNRLMRKNSSAEFYNFSYDVLTNATLSGVKGVSYAANFTYDNRLRKISEMKNISGNATVTNYAYDSLDRITQITLPNADTINLTYNSQNQLDAIAGVISNMDYTELNTIAVREYANGLTSNFTYDPKNIRLTRIETGELQHLNYTYDNVSNVLVIEDAINSRIYRMDYDALNRIIFAELSDNNSIFYSFHYTLSSIGQIIKIFATQENTTYSYSQNPTHAPSVIQRIYLSPSQPNITYPNGGEIVDKKATLTWTESIDPNDPAGYHIEYSNDSGISWQNIIFDYGYTYKLSDGPKIKYLAFSGNQSTTIYVNITKGPNATKAILNLTGLAYDGGFPTNAYLEVADPDSVPEWSAVGELRGREGFLDHFNDSSQTKELPFFGDENKTAYVELPKYAVVNSTWINITVVGDDAQQNDTTVAFWHFDEGSGGVAHDANGVYNVTLNDLWAWSTVAKDGAASFYPNALYEGRQNIIFDDEMPNGTIEFWFNPDVTLNTGYNTNIYFFSATAGTTNHHLRWDGSLHKLRFYMEPPGGLGGVADSTTQTFSSGTWYHIVATWGSAGQKLYVNGVLEGNNAGNTNSVAGINVTLYIGSGNNTGFFDGKIDEMGVSNIQRTPQPAEMYLEVGTPDDVHEWNYSGTYGRSPEIVDINISAINAALATCTPNNHGTCDIPFLFHSDNVGEINITQISVLYANVSKTPDFSEKINDVIESCSCSGCTSQANKCTVPFLIHSDTPGTIKISDVRIASYPTSYDWNTTEVVEGVNYRVRIMATDGYVNSSYDESDADFTINHSVLDVSNLSVLYVNTTERIFEFLITNHHWQTLANITWDFDTGASNISSQYNTTLQANETLSAYIYYNYAMPGNYTVTASARVGDYANSQSIQVEVIS